MRHIFCKFICFELHSVGNWVFQSFGNLVWLRNYSRRNLKVGQRTGKRISGYACWGLHWDLRDGAACRRECLVKACALGVCTEPIAQEQRVWDELCALDMRDGDQCAEQHTRVRGCALQCEEKECPTCMTYILFFFLWMSSPLFLLGFVHFACSTLHHFSCYLLHTLLHIFTIQVS